MNTALLLASGLGLRMNQGGVEPKQFFVLGDKPILIHTIERFETHNEVDAICVVCLPGWEEYLREKIDKYAIKKVRWIVTGGDTRQTSIYNGLCALEKDCDSQDMIIVHDGVRPFITSEIISKNIETAEKFGNAMTGMQSTDTLIHSRDGRASTFAMERDSTYTIQTPQTYRLGYGLELYRRAYDAGKTQLINCCELFIEFGERVYIVNGRKSNIKLTTQDDINYLNFLHTIFCERGEQGLTNI